jgi:hypothetical protein
MTTDVPPSARIQQQYRGDAETEPANEGICTTMGNAWSIIREISFADNLPINTTLMHDGAEAFSVKRVPSKQTPVFYEGRAFLANPLRRPHPGRNPSTLDKMLMHIVEKKHKRRDAISGGKHLL